MSLGAILRRSTPVVNSLAYGASALVRPGPLHFLRGGYKLSALEIEEVLREHEAIADVAVVGIPDETWGELAVAAVLAQPGREQELEEELVRTWTKQRLASYKVPKRIVLLEDFPRNPVGKVIKPELRRQLAERFEGTSHTS